MTLYIQGGDYIGGASTNHSIRISPEPEQTLDLIERKGGARQSRQ